MRVFLLEFEAVTQFPLNGSWVLNEAATEPLMFKILPESNSSFPRGLQLLLLLDTVHHQQATSLKLQKGAGSARSVTRATSCERHGVTDKGRLRTSHHSRGPLQT